jgi:hypothetical protein
MLKALIIFVAIVIAVVNISAQTSSSHRRVVRRIGVVKVGPSTTYIKEGLTTEEVVKLLGEPTAISKNAGDPGTTYEFPRAEGRVLMVEFVNGLLVSSRTELRATSQAGR